MVKPTVRERFLIHLDRVKAPLWPSISAFDRVSSERGKFGIFVIGNCRCKTHAAKPVLILKQTKPIRSGRRVFLRFVFAFTQGI